MRSPFRAKHINDSMLIEDLVRWRQWRHYSVTLKNSAITMYVNITLVAW